MPHQQLERSRLSALRQLKVLDSPFETLFDTITQVASDVCGMPIALISLVDEDRQWFKANVGLPGLQQTPREYSFCTHTIMRDEVLEVEDATQDARFASSPLVTGEPNIRYYAGAPITLPLGECIGTLCVIGHQSGRLNDDQKNTLAGLARIVSKALVARHVMLRTQETNY